MSHASARQCAALAPRCRGRISLPGRAPVRPRRRRAPRRRPAVANACDQRRLVDQPAARDVDQDRAPFHQAQPALVEKAAGLRCQRHMQRDDVGCGQQLLRARAIGRRGHGLAGGVDDSRAQRRQASAPAVAAPRRNRPARPSCRRSRRGRRCQRGGRPPLPGAYAGIEHRSAGAARNISAASSRPRRGCSCPACCRRRCRASWQYRGRWC